MSWFWGVCPGFSVGSLYLPNIIKIIKHSTLQENIYYLFRINTKIFFETITNQVHSVVAKILDHSTSCILINNNQSYLIYTT